MQNSSTNIKFNYEYRDAAGYRNSGSIIFKCTVTLADLKKTELEIRDLLFDEEFFYPYKLSIPLIHFDKWNPELDHDWYRFEDLEFTFEPTTDPRSFENFLQDLRKFARQPVV